MKALVTGGAGFIGSNLVAYLVELGHEVVVLDNFSSGHQKNLMPFSEVSVVDGDVRDSNAVRRSMGGVEVVYHLAASVGNKRAIDHPIMDSEVNVLGTLQVLEAARMAGVRKIVTSSSAGVYGELIHFPIQENHPAEPDTPYGASKLCQEKHCLAYAKLYDLEAICLRYFNVYGPNQRFDAYGNVIPIFMFKMLNGQSITVFGDGEQTRDFVNVHDVVQANINAGESRGISGAFNIASGTQVTINSLVDSLRAVTAVNPEVIYASPRPGDVRSSMADISAARRAIGFDPEIDFEMGLAEYAKWARTEFMRP